MRGLIARVKNLLLTPRTEWDVIAAEPAEPGRLLVRYVIPLVLIPTLAIVVGLSVLGVEIAGQQTRAPLLEVGISSALFFTLSILAVFLFASVINWLAPRFGANRDYRKAFKVAAYSITAAMVAGALTVAPALQIVALLGAAYSLYLLFVGTPKVMAPEPKSAMSYSIVTAVAAIVIAVAVGAATMVAAPPTGNLFPNLPRLAGMLDAGAAPLPGAAVGVEAPPLPASAGVLSAGGGGRVVGGDLRGALPITLVGLNRVAVGVERSGLAGQRAINVEAEYRDGRRQMLLQIVYSKTIAERLGFGGPSTSEYDRETAEGYSRRRRVGEAIIVEDWDQVSETGGYGRLVEDRFYVKASGGGGVKPDDLREAVEVFGQETLAQFEAES